MPSKSPVSPPPVRPLLAVLLFLPLLFAGSAGAAELADLPPFSVAPTDLLAAAEEPPGALGKPAPGDGVEVLLYESSFTFDREGRRTFRRRLIYRPLTASGAEAWDEVSAEYSPWHQERPLLRARVVTPAGAVHELDPATISEVSLESELPDVYQDRRRLVAPLPAHQPGSVVEELIEVVDSAPLFAAGSVHRQPLTLGVPTRFARLVLDAPEELPLRVADSLPEGAETSEARSSGRVRRVFDLRDQPGYDEFPEGLPPEEVPYPYVAFATGGSWSSIARAYSEVVDRQVRASSLDGVEVPGAELDSQWEQIAARTAWLQSEVRYTGVNLGEAAIVPRSPAETLARRYGDCKDKATLLVALLRELGIPSFVALLRAGSEDDLHPELPGLGGGSFDHAIVYVPGNPALWIDATDPYSPLGELPLAAQGRLALVASASTQGLVRTPVAGPEVNRIVETREVYLAEFGPGRVVETSELWGAPAQSLRSDWDQATEEEVRERLLGYAEGTYGAGRIGGVEHSPLGDLGAPLTVRLEADAAGFATTDLSEGVLIIPREGLFQRLQPAVLEEEADGKERKSDFLVDEPHEIEWRYRIHVPPGFAPRDLPESGLRSLGPASYSTEVEAAGDEVRLTLRFRLEPRRITATELAVLRGAVDELREEGDLVLWFDQVGWSHLAAGRIGEAIAELRRLAELHPGEALHPIQLAQAALAGGLVDEARRQARAAVELEPESVLAHQTLGLTLLNDSVGRQFGPGFDREGAQAAFRRALEIDPEYLDSAINLALVLEHDEAGGRYQEAEGLAEAIEVYLGIQDQIEGSAHAVNLPVALLWAGRFEEVLELLDGGDDEPGRFAMFLAAEAMVSGPEAAITRADRRHGADPPARAGALASASQELSTRRYYPQAAALLRAASRSAPNPAQVLTAVQLLEKTRRHEELPTSADTPEAMGPRFFAIALDPELGEEGLRELLAPSLLRELGEDSGFAGFVAGMRAGVESGIAGVALPRDTLIDLGIAGVRTDVRGLPGVGHAIRLTGPVPGGGEDETTLIVTREDGRLGIAGFEEAPETLGLLALDRLRAGDLDGARACLDRAVELTEPPAPDDHEPSSVRLLHRFWPAPEPVGREAIELAASVLGASWRSPEETLERVRQARRRSEEPAFRLALDQAEAAVLAGLERPEELLEVGERIRAATGSDAYWSLALTRLDRSGEVLEALDRRLEEDPENEEALRGRALLLFEEGELEAAMEAFTTLLERPGQGAVIYNQAAWLAVVLGRIDEQAVAWARLGAERSSYAAYPVLHTLATVYAEVGHPGEAYKLVLQGIEKAPGRSVRSDDWYVFGRIAEHYGLPEAAREYYRRVEAPQGKARAADTWSLASRRLAALGEELGSPL